MSDEHARTLALPLGVKVTFRFSRSANYIRSEWEPGIPEIRSPRHRRKFFEAYQAARRSFAEDIAIIVGGAVGVADVNGEFETISPGTKH
jgi:hypothetical protein